MDPLALFARRGRRCSGASSWLRWGLALLLAAPILLAAPVLWAQDAAPAGAAPERPELRRELGELFDAVVARTAKSFWNKDRLADVDWNKRAAEVRPGVVAAPNLEEAARRINALLAELKTSHTGLLTPDDVEYYILLDVFNGAGMPRKEFDKRFWGAGVTYPGIGHFSVKIDGRDFVEAVMEGSPADSAGLKVGDQILDVDGAAYHPIRSFRGKVGDRVDVRIRRRKDGPPETLAVPVVSIAPLHAFRAATSSSVRIIERAGLRIGYIHIWASVGRQSLRVLDDALTRLHVTEKMYVDGNVVRIPRRDPPEPLHGLIVDMRGKIGGTARNAGQYLNSIDPRGPLVRMHKRSGSSGAANALRGRTAVLIDHHTRSTAELFVHSYRRERQGPLIGTRTAGAVSAARGYAMPGGNLLYLAVTGLEVDGEVLEGVGVDPDIEVARPVPYANGADPVLEAAVDYLARKVERLPRR